MAKSSLFNRFAVACVAAAFAAGASAATFLQINSLGSGENLTFDYNGSSVSFWAGEQNISIDEGSGYGTPFASYCVDLDHVNAPGNIYQVTPLPVGVISNGGKVAWLYSTYGPGVSTNPLAAALQLAIWDATYDGGDGLAAGLVRSNGSTTGGVASQAATWIASIGSNTDTGIWFDAFHDNGRYQSMIGPPGSATPVPEPFTMLLTAATLAVAVRRWRRTA